MVRIIITIVAIIFAVQWATSAGPSTTSAETKVEQELVGVVLNFGQKSPCTLTSPSAKPEQRIQVMITPRGLQISEYNYQTCKAPGNGVLKAAANSPAAKPVTIVKPVYKAVNNGDDC